ncbi:unnamed protein product, partial [Prorocentrum cordatum]
MDGGWRVASERGLRAACERTQCGRGGGPAQPRGLQVSSRPRSLEQRCSTDCRRLSGIASSFAWSAWQRSASPTLCGCPPVAPAKAPPAADRRRQGSRAPRDSRTGWRSGG